MIKNQTKKILVVSPTPSHPQNAGNRSRIYRFLKSLKENSCEIHFLYYDRESRSKHVISGPDKRAMGIEWSKFIHVPSIPEARLRKRAPYVLHLSQFRVARPSSLNGLAGKCSLLFSFAVTPQGFRYLVSMTVGWIKNCSGNFFLLMPKSSIADLLYLMKTRRPGLYCFLRAKYHEARKLILVTGYKKSSTLKHFFSLNYVKIPDTVGISSVESGCSEPQAEDNGLDAWYNSGLDRVVELLHREYKYDIVIAEYVFMSKVLQNFDTTVLKVIDTHDVFTNRDHVYKKAGIKDTFFSTTKEAEAKGLDRADLIIAIQEEERIRIAAITRTKVITIGHKVRIRKPERRRAGRNNILYIGSGNTSNIHGIKHFIEHIFPSVRTSVPEAHLLAAGAVCKYIANTPGLIKLGEVSSIDSVYEMADVVINPSVVGTGLKIKNIEALGYSKPLVSTPHCAEGLTQKDNAFFIASTDNAFSECLAKLLLDDCLYEEMSKKAFRFALDYNDLINQRLVEVFGLQSSNR